ncbi:MAG: hypothetical protein IKV32_01490 [Muribaculaceae bacterium]|nr:hypothetical protein [Muribaculaceae bacterium]
MLESFRIIILIVLSCISWSCGSVDNKLVDSTLCDFNRYISTNSYDSLSILHNSININPELGLAVLSKVKDSTPTAYEVALAVMVTPQTAAEIVLHNLLAMPKQDSNQAKMHITKIASWYSLIDKENYIPIFKETIDSCVKTYDIPQQAKLYTISSSPKQLGCLLKQDSITNKALILEVKSIYHNNDLIDFNNALK